VVQTGRSTAQLARLHACVAYQIEALTPAGTDEVLALCEGQTMSEEGCARVRALVAQALEQPVLRPAIDKWEHTYSRAALNRVSEAIKM
jgi:hypothetical protein